MLLARLGAGGSPRAVADRRGRRSARSGSGIRDVRAFTAISAIHVIDNSTRTGFLTFLPFLLIAKGATVPSVGLALMLVFIGGAVGKFACGALADRVGVIRTVVVTELVTGAGILFLLTLPLGACLVALPVLGVALNGTSSVLYGSVADLVSSERRARSYAIFYTLGIGASALSPFVYGLLSDWGGVRLTLAVVGCVVFLTLPFTLPLRAAPVTVAARTPRSALGLGPARGGGAGGGRWASDHDTLTRLLRWGVPNLGSGGSGLSSAGNGSPGPPAAPPPRRLAPTVGCLGRRRAR